MCAYAASVPSEKVTWVLAADGKQMRAYECHRIRKIIPSPGTGKRLHYTEQSDWELVPLPYMFQMAESPEDYQTGHSHRGSLFGYTSSVRHTVEPHVDVTEDLKYNFMQAISKTLRQARLKKHFDYLIIAAPPKLLGKLRKYLGDDVMKRVVAELPKELAHCNSRELLGYVRSILPLRHAKSSQKEIMI